MPKPSSRTNTFTHSALSLAMAGAIGLSALTTSTTTSAETLLYMSWSGAFTLLAPNGTPLNNADYGSETNYYGWRTPVSGTFEFNLDTGAGSGTVVPFSFASGGLASATSISMQAIGDGMGGPGTLILGNMGFNWSGTNGIPVSIVLDAAGMYSCLSGGFSVSDTCAGVGTLAASDNTKFGGKLTYTLPMGPAPIATTTWNTTTIGGTSCGLGCNPSGTLPLIADTIVDAASHPAGDVGIGGSPMVAGPFPAFNANFDVLNLHIDSIIIIEECPPFCDNAVPLPAAAWLFGSGLLGLLGVARRQLQQRRR